jgi:5'-nucleotidase / UDP-sugar diphosphatase
MRFISRRLLIGLLAGIGFIAPALAAKSTVTFILTNDIYKMEGAGDRGGFARLNAVVRAERAKGGNVYYVHAGDMISPSLLSGIDKGEHTVALTNIVPFDMFAPGNHEYDFGKDVFFQRMKQSKYPWGAANLRNADGSAVEGIAKEMIIERGGVKIGIVPLTDDHSPVTASPGDLQFLPTVETGVAVAKELRKAGAEFVVAVVHADREQDRALFESRAFDLILTGHDHDLMLLFDGRTAMAESKEEAEFVTAIDVAFDVEEKDGKRTVKWYPGFRLIDTANVTPDPETQAKTDEYMKLLDTELGVEIGKTATALDSRKAAVRTGEAAIGNLIADATREAVGAEIGITNGGGIRGNKEYAAGSALTRKDVFAELPFGNRTVKIEVTGETVWAALENGVSEVENAAGRFPQVSGLSFVYDPAKPKGGRVSSVMVGGAPIDKAKTYVLATNDYMYGGGDGYTMFKSAKPLFGLRESKLMANDVMAYISAKKEIAPKIEGRIKSGM